MEQKGYKIKVTQHAKIDGHISYYLTIEGFNNKKLLTIIKRYSELKMLNDKLRKESSSNNFPKFPPKSFFTFGSEEFINKRQQELNSYFTAISDNSELSSLPSIIKFIEDEYKKDEAAGGNKSLRSSRTTASKDESNRAKYNSYATKNYKKWNTEEFPIANEKFLKIVNEYKIKFVDIEFQVEKENNPSNEKKYFKLINEGNIFESKGEEEIVNINKALTPGSDANFELIGVCNDNVIKIENEIKAKMEDILKKVNNIPLDYDTNEIIAPILSN